jgi:tetratricopeptide (TPR) repeat protein
MKKLSILSLFLLPVLVLRAQSADDANKALYNERYQKAERIYHQLLKQNPASDAAWYGVTKSYLLQNEIKPAADSLLLAPASVKETPYGHVAMGWLRLFEGNATEANHHFQQALKETKEKDGAILAAVAEAHIAAKNGDANYAVELANKAIKRDKDNAALYVLLGDAWRKSHNGSEAYKAYREALEKNGSYAPAHHKIGEIFLTQKNTELYLQHFNNAIAADATYAPALYHLYRHAFYHDAAKAMEYYNRYLANADVSIENEYDLTDLLYLNKQYDAAIEKANRIIAMQDKNVEPRLYKLIGYSYAAKKDSAQALNYMVQYFDHAPDSVVIAKDFETMSTLQMQAGSDSLASVYLVKATEKVADSAVLFGYYKQLADLAKQNKNYNEQARWMERYYTNNEKANNLDLYYWGLAHFLGGDYVKADTVFGMYVQKYPEQSFGYYWQAKSKALADTNMTTGIAVPAYQKLIEVLDSSKTDPNYKKWMVEAYGYLAAYEANSQKDYAEAVEYFEKVLEVDASNEDAKKYIAILEKRIEK